MRNRSLSLCIIFVLSGLFCGQIFAETFPLYLDILKGSAQAFRYQVNGIDDASWFEVDGDERLIFFEAEDKAQDILYIQYTQDRVSWKNCAAVGYDLDTGHWRALEPGHLVQEVLPSEGKSSLRVSGGGSALLPLGDLQDHYTNEYGITARISYSSDSASSFALFGEFGYGKADSKNILYTGFNDMSAGVGSSFRTSYGPFQLSSEISGGAILHVPEYREGYEGSETYIDEYGSIGIEAGMGISEDHEIFLRGRLFVFPEQERLGLLSGIQAGATVGL